MVIEFFKKLFDNDFMPHGHCYFWDPAIVWTNAISGSLIALAYLTIPFSLLYIVRVRKDLTFTPLIVLFAAFILSCSATHIMDVINIWNPMYRLDSSFRVITAVASLGTAFMLVKISPQILSIPNSDVHKKLNEELKEQIIRLQDKDRTVKERTHQLQIQNETFKVAEVNAKFGSYIWNMNTGLLEYSDNLFRLFGYEPQEFVPTLEKFQSFIHPDDLQQVIKNGEETMQTGKLVETPYRFINKTGKIKHFRSCGSFTGDDNNRILIGTVQDITKDIEDAEQLKTKNLELELTNAELKSFNYIASHDLQEPLRKIQVFSRLILEGENFSEKTRDYFSRITTASERMRNLIISLRDFSRINKAELIFESCNLNTVVEESKNDLHVSIVEKQAIIEYENLPTVNGLHSQLAQLFTNLIDNAIKYSQAGIKPHIKITASIIKGIKIEHPSATQNEYNVIKIVDNGIGFENEYATKIFEIFQRLHNKNEYSGTGIGLAIVKKIVTNHNGFIMAEGKRDIGSTFTIYIPTL